MDATTTESFVNAFWDAHIVPTITDYIRIPNKSPAFDPNWEANGHMEAVLRLALDWLDKHPISGATVHVGRKAGVTPLILVDVPATRPADGSPAVPGTVLMYGHLDKQPEMTGWDAKSGPWEPRMEDGKLYGRGGADDGYALFASVAAIAALHDQGVPHARCVLMIEFSEESGSPDLPGWVDHFADLIDTPDLVVCLDSGAGNYDQLWSTTSLRGMMAGTVRADVLTEGVHSGDASGVVPGSFAVLRQLMDRIEDPATGEIKLAELHVDIPKSRIEQAQRVASMMGDSIAGKYPFLGGVKALSEDPVELILNRTWRPTVTLIGQGGVPTLADGGNVMRPYTELKLSFRLPPTLDPEVGKRVVTKVLSEDPPSGARITVNFDDAAAGWNAPELADWLAESLDVVSETFFGKPALHMGEGGTIPFMGMLHAKFPSAQFVITGVLGPGSNAHGPNEFLHVPYAKKITACITHILGRFGTL
jgi:acetylornithine deacetylase/succinyl-diaminopimelate desuccinylase-like protein